MSMLELDKDTFEAEVLNAEGKVFVDFYGDGCVPCKALMPFVHECAEKYAANMGLPVLAIYEGGKQIASCVKDDATQENIENMIKANI